MANQFAPYLGFAGNAREALEFYQQVFGGEINALTYADGGVVAAGEQYADYYMHAEFRSEHAVFYVSDMISELGSPQVTVGDNISLALMLDDAELGRRYFEALGEGGKVDMPYEIQSWGDAFGGVTDRFGIPWMINASAQES